MGSGTQIISPTDLDGAWTHITEFVVPRSIPATVARPRNPNLAANAHMPIIIPIIDGNNVVIILLLSHESFFIRFFFFFIGLGLIIAFLSYFDRRLILFNSMLLSLIILLLSVLVLIQSEAHMITCYCFSKGMPFFHFILASWHPFSLLSNNTYQITVI